MKICSVCSKSSMFPEIFGEHTFCKICSFKLNFFWKEVQFKNREEVETQKMRALDKAKTLNCSDELIQAIERFFRNELEKMNFCEECGIAVSQLNKVGDICLCNRCSKKIDYEKWCENEYVSNEEVEKTREKILKKATKHHFSSSLLNRINVHFDNRIDENLIGGVSGFDGQKLKVYKSYCVLITPQTFDKEDVAEVYREMMQISGRRKKEDEEEVNVLSLASNFLKGGILKTGAKFALSMMSDSSQKHTNQTVNANKDIHIVYGEYTINYDECNVVDFQGTVKEGENYLGYMRFKKDNGEEAMFFFEDGEQEKRNLCGEINELIGKARLESRSTQQKKTRHPESVADELIKFKSLLDMGAITKEEFDAKKKELLDL